MAHRRSPSRRRYQQYRKHLDRARNPPKQDAPGSASGSAPENAPGSVSRDTPDRVAGGSSGDSSPSDPRSSGASSKAAADAGRPPGKARMGADVWRQPEYRPLRQMLQRQARGGRARSFRDLIGRFLRFLRYERPGLAAASLVVLTLSVVLGLIPPYGTKIVVDYVLGDTAWPGWARAVLGPVMGHPLGLLGVVTGGMVMISLMGAAVGLWSRWQMTRISKRLTVAVRRRAFSHAVRLPLHRVYELKSGGVSSILRDDAGAVGEMVFSILFNPWRAVVQLIGTLLVLALVDWRLLVGGLTILPLVWVTHRTWINRIRPLWRDIRATRRYVDAHATESFGGIRIVRGFGRQQSENAQFTRNNHLMARQELYAWWWSRGIDFAWQVIIPASMAGLLFYGGWRILQDRAAHVSHPLTVGDLFMFVAYLGMLLGPIATLANTAAGMQNQLAGLDRVLDLLDEPQEMPDKPGARELDPGRVAGRVVIDQVGFTYPGTDDPVLEDINLTAEPGRVIAFVGPSGAGKTTLCNLIARFHDPTAGAIYLDGTDLRDTRLADYRRLLGIVEQDVFLFDGTVRENIAYGRREADDAQIIAAAKRANAHGFITDLPEGYETLIGERGVKLSGGQRQRLSIARAILADPVLLILDEATSNLDTESEQLIQSALHELFEDRTTFVIAHRLSTIAHADLIVVIEAGRVVETGTHEQLMANSGSYRTMVERQHHGFTMPRALAVDDRR